MKGYAEQEVFSVSELALLHKAQALIEKLPATIDGEYVRCHEVVRAAQRLLDLDPLCVADGWYGMVDHSWLWVEPYEWPSILPNILDVYAVGRLPQVQLVHCTPTLPFEYRRGDRRKDIKEHHVVQLLKAF